MRRPIELTRLITWGLVAAAIFAVATARATAQAPAQLALIDINEAPAHRLRSLPEIDAARAEAIIKGRPYGRTDDLVMKNIIPADVFEGLKNRIVVRPR